MKKPIIGLTAFLATEGPAVFKVNQTYVDSIVQAGGIPMIIPVYPSAQVEEHLYNMLDGLLVPGGQDVAPSLFGEEPVPSVVYHRLKEDLFEIALIRKVRENHKPILGICRGEQIINVAFGGSLVQDIPSQTDASICHLQSMKIRSEATHSVNIEEESVLSHLLGTKKIMVNSYHHQSVKAVADGFKVSAYAPDGIVEAIESLDGSVIGVQWHPEGLVEDEIFGQLFKQFIYACQENKGKF